MSAVRVSGMGPLQRQVQSSSGTRGAAALAGARSQQRGVGSTRALPGAVSLGNKRQFRNGSFRRSSVLEREVTAAAAAAGQRGAKSLRRTVCAAVSSGGVQPLSSAFKSSGAAEGSSEEDNNNGPSSSTKELVGVLLLNLGGPETLSDVKPFLYILFADPDIIRLPPSLSFLQEPLAFLVSTLRAPKSMEAYESIGKFTTLTAVYQVAVVEMAE